MKRNYKCSSCRKQFSVTKGTIFEGSPVPLQKWFVSIWLVTSHKKGISSNQLSRDIGVTQKTAWFMLQRIRFVFEQESFDRLDNQIEADETYVGGKNKNRHKDKKVQGNQGRSSKDKVPVFGLLERGGNVVAMKVANVSAKELQSKINDNVSLDSTLYTDEWTAYTGLSDRYDHETVNHGYGRYVVGDAHVNTIEGFWSILKRGIFGIYHCVSSKHIDKYIKEFEFRYNNRDFEDKDKFDKLIGLSNVKLSYKDLTKDVA